MSIRRMLTTVVFVFAFAMSMSAAFSSSADASLCDPGGSGLC